MDQTQIANVALQMLGEKRISQIDEGTPLSIRVLNLWDATWFTFLESHDWRFARKLTTLAMVGTDPSVDWAYAYTKPTDCLMPRFLVPTNESGQQSPSLISGVTPYPFEVIGTEIHTDLEDAMLRYTYKVTNYNLVPGSAAMGFAVTLARGLAIGVTGSKAMSKIREQLKEDWGYLMGEAIRINDSQDRLDPPDKVFKTLNPWQAARQ